MQIEKLRNTLDLGQWTEAPEAIAGGLLHKMYAVTTTKGTYAVKVLNGEIMKRPEALRNMINSEKVAAALQTCIPVVAALELQGKQVQEQDGVYYMVFPWVEGQSVFPGDICTKHCEIIGDLLGKIHHKAISVEGLEPEAEEAVRYPWERYLSITKEQPQKTWMVQYEKALADICAWNRGVCQVQEVLSQNLVISHRDLDPKNVLWHGEEVLVIDWEAAGYVNPYQELLEVINYWADDGQGGWVQEYLKSIVKAYCKHMDISKVNWSQVFAGSYAGMLGWLEYNVKRALGMEAVNEEERRLGEEQVVETICALYDYQRKEKEILESSLMMYL